MLDDDLSDKILIKHTPEPNELKSIIWASINETLSSISISWPDRSSTCMVTPARGEAVDSSIIPDGGLGYK